MFKLSNKVYDIAKFAVTILLPAVSTAYVSLAKIYSWPYATEVAQTIAVICTLIGTIIGISSHQYWQEQEVITAEPQDDDPGEGE